MKKKLVLSFIIIFIIGSLGFGVFKFISDFNADKDLTKEKMNEILSNYDSFNATLLSFVQSRDYLYELRANTYVQDYAKNIAGWNGLIKAYEEDILKVEEASKKLKEPCKYEYGNPNVNSKCKLFKSTYEGAMNYYITDVKDYNKSVTTYNNYAEMYGYEKLNKASLVVYKKYIDYDKDKEYFGKEEQDVEK